MWRSLFKRNSEPPAPLQLNPADLQGRKVAFLIVDAQQNMTDPDLGVGTPETAAMQLRIQGEADRYRAAGALICPVFYTSLDEFVIKQRNSAFSGGVFVEKEGGGYIKRALAKVLRERGIDTVIVVGFQTSACAGKTAIDSHKNGFRTYLAEDLSCNGNATKIRLFTAPPEPKAAFEKSLAHMQRKGVIKARSEALLGAMQGQPFA